MKIRLLLINFSFFILFLHCHPFLANASKLNIKTVIPKSWSYTKITPKYLQFNSTTVPAACVIGSKYIDNGNTGSPNQMYCCKDPGTGPAWIACGGAGFWTLTGNNLYPTDAYPASTFRFGIGTNAPSMQLELDGVADSSDGIIATGKITTGTLFPNLGAGTRLMWYPLGGAFRAGYVNSTQWNNSRVPYNSVAMGKDTTANNNTATGMIAAGGDTNTASAIYSTVSGGQNNISSAIYSTISGGLGNTAAGDYSFAGGQNMVLDPASDNTFIWGKDDTSPYLTINDPNSFIIESAKVRLNPDVTSYLASPGTPSGPNLEIFSDLTNNTADILLVGNADPVGKIHFYRNTAGTLNQVSSIRSNNATGNIVFESSIAPAGDRFIFGTDAQNNASILLKDSSAATFDFAVTSPNSVRIVRGRVNANGTQVAGGAGGDITEYTTTPPVPSHVATSGIYTIDFTPPFASTPAITVTTNGTQPCRIRIASVTQNGFTVHFKKIDTLVIDQDTRFMFIAIGAKGAL